MKKGFNNDKRGEKTMGRKQSSERNLSMVMDFYEMTMSNGYFHNENREVKVVFDVFYRRKPERAG